MTSDIQETADRLLEKALEDRGGRDPREYYRERLRELKREDPDAYEEAVTYYVETLVPGIAAEEVDPLEAWLEYGRRLAELTARGRTVVVDEGGRARSYRSPGEAEGLVLHLPDDTRQRVLLVGLPRELSSAQQATYDLLVQGRQTLRESP